MVMYEMIISGYQETSMIQSDMTFLFHILSPVRPGLVNFCSAHSLEYILDNKQAMVEQSIYEQ